MKTKFDRMGFLALTLAVFLVTVTDLRAQDVSVGIGVGYQTSPYKGYDNDAMALPLISVEHDRFFIRGHSAGVKLFNEEAHSFTAGLSYDARRFKASKSDYWSLRQLDSRHSSVTADLGYAYKSDFGTLGLKASQDISGHSKGFSLNGSYSRRLDLESVYFVPAVGVMWENAKQIGYYYGISSTEARRSGLNSYDPDGGFTPYLGLGLGCDLTHNLSLKAGVKVQFLSNEIKDSPMVDDSTTLGGFLGVGYSF